ncbi:MAG TPA: hypothetical protein VGM75_33825 [Pseudonocardiaceae bacterium]|jgi:hypothetical protein
MLDVVHTLSMTVDAANTIRVKPDKALTRAPILLVRETRISPAGCSVFSPFAARCPLFVTLLILT